MREVQVHISRVRVKLRRIDRARARSVATGLSESIAGAVGTAVVGTRHGVDLGNLVLGVVKAPASSGASGISRQAASAATSAMTERLSSKSEATS